MAKFITTKQITSELEDLIKKADEKLYIISPYLKLSKDFRELLTFRNSNRKDTKIIFGKQELNPEQMTFLQSLRFVYLFFSEDLHAKCYINDNKVIVTSMNFYDFSMINNKEMGIIIDKNVAEDLQLYSDAWNEIDYIEKTSRSFDFVSKPVNISAEKIEEKISKEPVGVKYLSTTALSKELGLSSKELFNKFEAHGLINKKGEDWEITQMGKNKGAQTKRGQYGEYIAWPESILSEPSLQLR